MRRPAVRHLLVDSDVTGAQALLADVPVRTLPAVGLAFAGVKVAAEEAAFRGVVMDALRSSVGVTAAVVLQAALFGLVHYAHGVRATSGTPRKEARYTPLRDR